MGGDADDQALLDQVIEYYHQTLLSSPEALAYLEQRGIGAPEAIERFKLGYADRTLGLRLPEKHRKAGADLRGRLVRLGIYRASGHEHFNGSLIIPVFNEFGQVVEVYGRKRRDDLCPGTPAHLYLPGPHRGVWNSAALSALSASSAGSAGSEIILCESLIDALTFWVAGYRNVTASYGVQGFTEAHFAHFQHCGVQRVLIAFDRDTAGDRAAEWIGKGKEIAKTPDPDLPALAASVLPPPPIASPTLIADGDDLHLTVEYLTLIDTLALLHQHQRPKKTAQRHGQTLSYIEVTLDDIETANRLAHEVLGRTLDELPPQTHRLLRLLQAWVDEQTRTQQILLLTPLQSFFKWLVRERRLLINPAAELILPKRPQQLPYTLLSIQDIETILAQPDLHTVEGLRDRAMLEVFYATGLRRLELTQLDLSDLDARHRTLLIRAGKGQQDRFVPLGARALHWVERYHQDSRPLLQNAPEEQALFLTDQGKRFRRSALSARVKRTLEKAGIDRPGSCHLFRHACATHMLQGGADIRVIQALLGHRSLETTQIYTHVALDHLSQIHAATHPLVRLEAEADPSPS